MTIQPNCRQAQALEIEPRSIEPLSVAGGLAPTPWEFDPTSHEHVPVRGEPATAAYRTRSHRIVIRQANWPEDDVWIELSRSDVPALIEALRALTARKEG